MKLVALIFMCLGFVACSNGTKFSQDASSKSIFDGENVELVSEEELLFPINQRDEGMNLDGVKHTDDGASQGNKESDGGTSQGGKETTSGNNGNNGHNGSAGNNGSTGNNAHNGSTVHKEDCDCEEEDDDDDDRRSHELKKDDDDCDDDDDKKKSRMQMTPEQAFELRKEVDEICCSHGRKILVCNKDIDSKTKKTLCLDAENLGILVKGETVNFLGACQEEAKGAQPEQ